MIGTNHRQPLLGKRILIVEDQGLVALELQGMLERAGAEIAGPAGRLEKALKAAREETIAGALLDIDLNGERCWPVADVLAGRNVPFAFTTGFDASLVMPERFRNARVIQKPYNAETLADVFADVLRGAGCGALTASRRESE